MASGAVGCLELTIERLSKSSHISLVQNSSPQIIKLLYKEILSLKEALKEFDKRRSTISMKMLKTLEAEIIDAIYEFEDVLEPHLLNQFHAQYEEESIHPPLMLYSVDLQEIRQDVDSFIEMVNKMKRAYIHELRNPSPEQEEEEEEEEDEDDCVDFGGNESYNTVESSHLFMRIKDRLVNSFFETVNKMIKKPYTREIHNPLSLFTRIKDRLNSSQSEGMIVSLFGMAGIGKTTLAKKVFQDPFIVSRFSPRVFVSIGPKYRLHGILLDILRQLDPVYNELRLPTDTLLAKVKCVLLSYLRDFRFLIVLDDVWDAELCSQLLNLFPNNKKGTRVLVATRLCEVAACAHPLNAFKIPFLDKKESWDLLREKIFGEQESAFSYELEKSGKKIAENCEGLPLTIVTVANIMSKANKTIEYWNEVADDKQHSVYTDAYDRMSKVLYPSYDYLDQHLKACFLYSGAFPQNCTVYGHQLTDFWRVEGFLNSKPEHYLDPAMTSTKFTYGYVDILLSKSVIMFNVEVSGYKLHSSFWYLCNKEAAKTKLFYALNCLPDALPEEGIEYHRRLCIRNSILFAIEDAYNSIASASTVRSLLCTGPFHQYPVPLPLEHLRLLRVLDARIRLYEFPLDVVQLFQLRYLALTYDGDLPPSISNLLNLQQLIVGRYCMINYVENVLYLPIEIWNMKELEYLHCVGRDLPHPCERFLLPKLLQLIGVGPQSCTKDVLEKIPNLKDLGIQIVLSPDATETLRVFDHISNLHQLQALQCDIVNPIWKTKVVTAPHAPLSDLPSSLTKLNLKGSGYPWEEMRKISSLPKLKYLTLSLYAFRGPKWEVRDCEFQSLEFLHIEDADLVQWKFVSTNLCLPAIKYFRIVHCYKLKEIPLKFGTSLRNIRVVNCNPMAMNWATKLKKEWDDNYGDGKRSLTVDIRSSL